MSTFNAPYGAAQGAEGPPRPPTVREHIVASKEFFDSHDKGQMVQIAIEIVQRHWGDISHFMLGQRQMGMILPASYKRKDFPALSIEYQRLSNQETLILTVYPDTINPRAGEVDVEFNYDGYFLWVHCESNRGNASNRINNSDFIVGPFDIYFNEYLLEERFAPARPFGGYLLLFGSTAMLCQSVQDSQKKNAFITSATAAEKPKDVLPRPGWGKYNQGVTQAGISQNQIDKVLGYWLFDWTNPHNPCMSLVDYNSPQNTQKWLDAAGTHGATAPSVTRGLWFEKADKSPLDHKGSQNNFYTALSPGGLSGEVLVVGAFFSEFYDRTKGRTVKQSWTKDMRTGLDISVGDSPLRWGTGYNTAGFFNGGALTVDLTPKSNTKADNKGALLDAHDGVDASFGGSIGGAVEFERFLSSADLQIFQAWQQDVAQRISQYEQSIQQYINQWHQKWSTADNQKLLNQADNVIGYWADHTDASGHKLPGGGFNPDDLLYAIQDDGPIIWGPFPQQYYFAWNAHYTGVNPLPRIANRYLFTAPFGNPSLVDTDGNPEAPLQNLQLYGGSIFGGKALSFAQAFDLADRYVKDPTQNARQQQSDEYEAIRKDHPIAKLPDRPKLGKDYRNFSYKTITGGNGSFSFPANFSGGS